MSNSSASSPTLPAFNPNDPAYANNYSICLGSTIESQYMASIGRTATTTIPYVALPLTHTVALRDLTPKDVVVDMVLESRTSPYLDTRHAYFRVAVKKTNCFITWANCDPTGTVIDETGRVKVKDWNETRNVLSPVAEPEPEPEPAPASNSSAAPAEPAVQPKRMLVAMYTSETLFDIPKGIDLEAPGWRYAAKRDVLYISGPDGVEIEVRPRYSATECADFKYPDDTHLVAEEDGYDAPDDEEED